MVGKLQLDHQDLLARLLRIRQITAFCQASGDLRMLLRPGGNFDEQRVRVHGFVVVHAHDVSAGGGDGFAGAQKRARLIGHAGDVRLAHGGYSFPASCRRNAHLQQQVSSATSG